MTFPDLSHLTVIRKDNVSTLLVYCVNCEAAKHPAGGLGVVSILFFWTVVKRCIETVSLLHTFLFGLSWTVHGFVSAGRWMSETQREWSPGHCASRGAWRPPAPWTLATWWRRSARCWTPTIVTTSSESASCCSASMATPTQTALCSGRWRCASCPASPSMVCDSNASQAPP